jgi:3',5'-cyclic AMP phosphodiesterase CpdA
MHRPFLIAQLSDPHVGADWIDPKPDVLLASAVEAVLRLEPEPDGVIVSGDLVEGAQDWEYERIKEVLAPLGMPVHVLPGNHDDREGLHRHFGVPGEGGAPVQYAAELGPLRLLVLDSTVPGHEHGELDAGRLEWLDAELSAAPGRPALIAVHHPPLTTGAPAIDAIALREDGRRALGEVLERHPQVVKVVAGHVHRTVAGDLGGRPVLAIPSTYAELRLEFRSSELATEDGGRGFAVHTVADGELVSHVVNLP